MTHALFICKPHQEHGGWNDMVCVGSIDECKEFADRVIDVYGDWAWGHIVDLSEQRIVCDVTMVKTLLGGVNPYLPVWVDSVWLELKGIP